MSENTEGTTPPRLTVSLLEALKNGWYHNPHDPRCPHDAWLTSLELPLEHGDPGEVQQVKTVRIVLLGAYHDGLITFTYSNVEICHIGLTHIRIPGRILKRQDWIHDIVTVLDSGLIRHDIKWENAAWTIEAAAISYEWTPLPPDEAATP